MKPLTPEQSNSLREFLATLDINDYDWIELEDWLEENTRSFEPPTVIYKGSGFTGAQKGERK